MHKLLGLAATLLMAIGVYAVPKAISAEAPAKTEAAAPHASSEIEAKCVDPHACCEESKKVIETLQKLVHAINNGDMKTYAEYVDDNCTTFDETSKKLISGKENVVADMRQRLEKYAANGPTPLLSFTIDQPYAQVLGDTAVVNFVAYREIGGKHPYKEECKVTDVFVKKGDIWKKCHFRGAWKRA